MVVSNSTRGMSSPFTFATTGGNSGGTGFGAGGVAGVPGGAAVAAGPGAAAVAPGFAADAWDGCDAAGFWQATLAARSTARQTYCCFTDNLNCQRGAAPY